MNTMTTDVPRGLRGVRVSATELSDVRGDEGFYHYRQYPAVELAERRSYEDVCHLLLRGYLPEAAQSRAYAADLAELRALPRALQPVLEAVASAGVSPLSGLRTLLSHLAAIEAMPLSHDATAAELLANAERLIAVTPTVLAAIYRVGSGLSPVEPSARLGWAANYLWMVTGHEPSPAAVSGLQRYLILALDHGFNASTFTARVVTSTGADLGAAVVAALGALSGPLHGGAPSRALQMLEEIGTPSAAAMWVRERVLAGERIMGFGHPVYRTLDPRSESLKEVAAAQASPVAELAIEVERLVEATLAELKPDRRLQANIEYYAGVVMDGCGLPRELFTPTFAVARMAGWCAQSLEQAADRGTVIRPSARYVGTPPPEEVPTLG